MKQFLLFYYRGYYPRGAFNDYVDSFKTKEEVFHYINTLPNSLKEMIDLRNIELQVFNVNSIRVLTIDDTELLENILDDEKYILPGKDSDFKDLIEDCELEDRNESM